MTTVDLTNNGSGSTEESTDSTTDCWRLCGKEAGGAVAVARQGAGSTDLDRGCPAVAAGCSGLPGSCHGGGGSCCAWVRCCWRWPGLLVVGLAGLGWLCAGCKWRRSAMEGGTARLGGWGERLCWERKEKKIWYFC